MVTRKSRREIDKMRQAGGIVAEVLALVEGELKPGVTTGHLDRLAERHIRAAGAVPSFKGYGHKSNPFPASLCISIDNEVVHGIPGDRVVRDGQIVSVDAGGSSRAGMATGHGRSSSASPHPTSNRSSRRPALR